MSDAFEGLTPDIATLAVDYHRSPIKYRSWVLPPAELPEAAEQLLHVACGDGKLLATLSRQAEVTPSQFKTAAEFFIQQAFFARDADYYRVLGLRPTDGIERIKEHHRLLMKLFHPDRADTAGEWTDSLATRVNQAYTVLRKPESRREYDAALRAPHAVGTVMAGQQAAMKSRWARMPRPGFIAKLNNLPPGVRRHFPEFVLGGIGMFAALVVGALYLLQEPPLTGTGAIGGLAMSAPANTAGNRNASNTAGKLAVAPHIAEDTRDALSRSGPPAETAASQPEAAAAEPKSTATGVPTVTATSEPAVVALRAAPPAVPARAEPAPVKTAVPTIPAKIPGATVSTPPPASEAGRTAMVSAPPPIPAKTVPVDAQAQAKTNATAPPVAPPKIETVKPVTVASASAAAAPSGPNTSVPETTQTVNSASSPAPTLPRAEPEKPRPPEAAPSANVVSPAVPARTTATMTLASAAPVITATAPPVPRPALSDLDLDRLIGRFIGSYELGDINRFMALFHEDAKTGDKKYNKAETRKEYAILFSTTQMRQMMLQGFRWEKGEDVLRGQGRFTARVASQSSTYINEYAGIIRIEAANIGGVLLIKGLYHSVEANKQVPRIAESSRTAAK